MKSRKAMPQDAPDLSRRRFIVAGATVSGTFLLGIPLTAALAEDSPPDGDGRIGFYIHILENGDVAVGHAQPEIGQGLRTTLVMLVAEEMDLIWERIRIEPMPLGLTPVFR